MKLGRNYQTGGYKALLSSLGVVLVEKVDGEWLVFEDGEEGGASWSERTLREVREKLVAIEAAYWAERDANVKWDEYGDARFPLWVLEGEERTTAYARVGTGSKIHRAHGGAVHCGSQHWRSGARILGDVSNVAASSFCSKCFGPELVQADGGAS